MRHQFCPNWVLVGMGGGDVEQICVLSLSLTDGVLELGHW